MKSSDLRAALVAHVVELAGDRSDADRQALIARVETLLAEASEAELAAVERRVRSDDYPFGYHASIPLVRKIHRVLADLLLAPDSKLEGAERLAAVADQSLILLPNHLSYSDANLIEVLLARAGFEQVCDRLTVVAGPKVYTEPGRRFSSFCFGTIKAPQSSLRATGEARMRPRDVAEIARTTIECAQQRLDAGDVLLLFPEGSRSRDATLQPILPAVARYCDREQTWLVPIGVTGTEKFLGFSDVRPQNSRTVVQIGQPILASELRASCGKKSSRFAAALGRMIAETLPPAYRGVYATS